MTTLSVNINKIATIRNARGGNNPDVVSAAIHCQNFGAHGITVHPRPDQRHITYEDVRLIKPIITTEFNIEGYPSLDFISLVKTVCPTQVTLVPDKPGQLTSDHGWDTIKHKQFLCEIVEDFNTHGIRTSLFVDPVEEMIFHAKETGTDRIELYTESYAREYPLTKERAIAPFINAAKAAKELGLGINAGHDLDLTNLHYLIETIPYIDEVSIGHALISDALYMGLEKTISLYLEAIHVR